MKAEWINTEDGLTIQVTAQSDIDKVNLNTWFKSHPFRATPRLTHTFRTSDNDFTGFDIAYTVAAKKITLLLDGFVQLPPICYWKQYNNVLAIISDNGIRTLKTITYPSKESLDNNRDNVLLQLTNGEILTTNGGAIRIVGKFRTMGGYARLMKFINI